MTSASRDRLIELARAARRERALAEAWRDAWRAQRGEEPRKLRARVVQTSYRPFECVRLVVEGRIARVDPERKAARQFLFVEAYADPARAAAKLATSRSRVRPLRCRGPAVFAVHSWQALAWALPNGPCLRALRAFLDRRRFARLLEGLGLAHARRERMPRLVRYVPRRRALVRWVPRSTGPAGALWFKLFGPGGRDARLAASLRLLEQAAPRLCFRAPRLVGCAPERRAVVMSEVTGSVFSASMGAARTDAFAAIGRAVGSLHASAIAPAASLAPRAIERALVCALADVVALLPEHRAALEALLRELAARAAELPEPRLAPIHGNLFGDQIVMAGDDVGIVDWDDLTLGDPHYDVGRLVAHVVFGAARAGQAADTVRVALASLVESWERARGCEHSPARLAWHAAAALLVRAKISSLRPLVDDFEHEIAESIAEARRLLSGESPYLALR